ncbi:glycosyltransferase family 4 protein [Photobacterium kagoshimensis]|uniref:glycosyltransferase family 4 protein n=1 Tax=Photobacterium kagoshimensis TaxID=2910242 RepID=UPI003D0BB2DB
MVTKSPKRVTLILAGEMSSGGMADYLLCWVEKLLNDGVEVQVLTQKEVINLKECEYYLSKGVDFISLPYSTSKNLKVRYFSQLLSFVSFGLKGKFLKIRNKVESFNPDYIHIVDESIFYPFLKCGLLNALNKPNMVTIHDLNYHDGQFRSLSAKFSAVFSRKMLLLGNSILHFHNESLYDGVNFNENKLHVAEHPTPRRLVDKKKPSDVPHVGFFGRIEPYKGVNDIPDIFKYLEKEIGCNYTLSVVGRGYGLDRSSFENLRGKIIINNNFISNEEMHEYIASLDVLILPYRNATQSGVAYLAKAYGIRVVSYDVGALGEFSKNYIYGYNSEAGDVVGFSCNILSAIKSIVR